MGESNVTRGAGTAESIEKQRRDCYLARTLSNLARAKLDHAVALAAEKDGPPEKWEMRCVLILALSVSLRDFLCCVLEGPHKAR